MTIYGLRGDVHTGKRCTLMLTQAPGKKSHKNWGWPRRTGCRDQTQVVHRQDEACVNCPLPVAPWPHTHMTNAWNSLDT
jgi:hypothetical protein